MPAPDDPGATPLPLAGRCVLVTRPAHQARGLTEALRQRGGEPLLFPTLVIGPPEDAAVWDRVSARLESFHWLIFVSANAVDGFAERLREAGLPWPRQSGYAAIGRKTAAALGRRVDGPVLVPEEFRSEGLLARPEMAPEAIRGKRILLVRGEGGGRALLPETLEQRGALVDPVPVYARRPPDVDPAPVTRALAQGRLGAALFTSPATFRNLLSLLAPCEARALAGLPLVVISPVTASAVTESGFPEPHIAPEASDEGLVRALEEAVFSRERGGDPGNMES